MSTTLIYTHVVNEELEGAMKGALTELLPWVGRIDRESVSDRKTGSTGLFRAERFAFEREGFTPAVAFSRRSDLRYIDGPG